MPSIKIEKKPLGSNYRENALEPSSWNPTRNIFYIDVSNLSLKETEMFMNGVQSTLKAMKELANT